jgi:hypothetical protein
MYRWVNPEKGRYYSVYLDLDLFGHWVLTKAWGGLNSHRGQVRKVCVGSKEAGLQAIQALDKRRKKRGYCPVATPDPAPVQ